MSDSKSAIHYFPIANRGDVLRWIIRYCKLDIDIDTVNPEHFRAEQYCGKYPFCQLPSITVDGKEYCQTGAIARYLAKLGGIYPSDPKEALLADEAYDVFFQCMDNGKTYGMSDEQRAAAHKAWCEKEMKRLNMYLTLRSNRPFLTGSLTYADIAAYVCFHPKNPIVLSAEAVKEYAPALTEYINQLGQLPEFIALQKASDEFHEQLKKQF